MRKNIASSLQLMGTTRNVNKSPWIFYCFMILGLLISTQSYIVGQKAQILLNSSNTFQKSIQVQITEQKVQQFLSSQENKQPKNLFIFFDIEPADDVSWPDIYVNIYAQNKKDKTKVTHKKQCGKQGLQLETCYISNQDFNLQQEILIVKVQCDEEVKLLLFSEFMVMKTLQLNSCNKIDSSPLKRDSKLFKINIKEIAVKYEEIRIALTPINKIYGGQALHLYGSFGKYFPTPDNHDFTSFYAWEMGVLIRLLQEQLVQVDQIYILADYPQNYLFDLDTTLIEDSTKAIQMKTGDFYDDVIAGLLVQKKFILTIQHPQLNNYIRIKKYHGYLKIDKVQAIEYQKGVQKKYIQTFVTKHSNEISLSTQEFRIQKGIKKLQLYVRSQSIFNGVVYTIQTYENSKEYNLVADGQAHLAQLIENQKLYFVGKAIRHQNQTSSVSQASIKITTMQGKTTQRIFVCLVQQLQKCIDHVKNSSTSQKLKKDELIIELQNFKVIEDGLQMKKQIELTLNKDNFIKYTDGYKQQIILIEMTGDKNQRENVFSIQFMNVGIIDTLAQHETKTQKLQEQEFKIYRFTIPKDTKIHSLTFHVTTLYGFVQRFTTDADPSWKTQEKLKQMLITQPKKYVRQFENNVEIEEVDPQKTYYLVIFAKTKSMVSIRVQLKKFISHPVDQRNISYSNFLLNTLSSYQLTFSPGQLILLDFSQMTTPIVLLKASALLPLDACINLHHSDKKDVLPLEPNCEFRHKIGKKYEIYLNLQVTERLFGLYNGNNQTVTLSLSLQSHQQCMVRRLGEKQFFQAKMFSQLKTQELCIKYRLYKKGSLLVSFKPKSPLHHRSLKLYAVIGKTQSLLLTRYETIIDVQEVQNGCEQNYEDCYVSLIGKLSDENNETAASLIDEQLIFQVQYIDEPIDLLDGVPFTYMGPMSVQDPLRFKFSIYSINEPIRLVLQKQIGYFKVLAKLANLNEHFLYPQLTDIEQNTKENKTLSNETSSIYQTSNTMFYLYDIVNIPAQQLKKHCSPNIQIQHYRVCTLLVSVFPLDDKKISITESKFTIQTVQHISSLKQSQPVPGYLEPEMINMYEIHNHIQNSTIIVYVNGNSKESKDLICLQMSAKFQFGETLREQSTYRSRKGQHELIIPNAKKGTYTLILKGIKSSQKYCDFMLQYSVLPPSKQGEKETKISPIMSLKKSTPFKIEMTQNKTEYFMFFNHGKNANFKVLTLFQKLGQVLISVMPFATNEDQRNLITNIKNIDTLFKPQWKDSNSVEIYAKDKAYCGQCLYVIKVQCLKGMKGSIIVPQQHEQISMGQNILVYDQLLKSQKSYYRLYAGFRFSIKMKLISGAVSIKVINRQDNQTLLNKNYTATKEQIIAEVELKKNLTYEYSIDWFVQIESQDDAHFVISFKQHNKQSDQQNKDITKQLILGVPLPIIVVPTIKKCVSGTMEQEPTFIISSFSTFFVTPNGTDGLTFQFWVKNNQTNNKTQISKQNFQINKTPHSMLLKIKQSQNNKKLFDRNNTFQLCFQTTQVSSFDIIQSSHVNFLPHNSQILVDKNVNFTFMAGKDNILEINQCQGNSWISISQSFGTVHNLQSQINQIRKQNSLIQFQHQGPIFLSVQSDGIMSISWKEIDQIKGINSGYSIYDTASFKILPSSGSNSKLQLQISPLKEQSLTIIPKQRFPLMNGLKYEIYVEISQTDLRQAMNCHNIKGIKRQLQVRYDDFSKKQIFEIESINELKSKFLNSQYVLVSVKALLQMKNKVTGQIEKYRFFYPLQEVILLQKDLRSVTESDKNSNNNLLYFFIGMFFAIILIVVFIFFCGRKIRSYIDKIRRKRIAQENHFELKSQMQSETDKYYQKAMET